MKVMPGYVLDVYRLERAQTHMQRDVPDLGACVASSRIWE
jgi:hypothetical protein